jgi:hypothetical protein
MWIVCKSVDNGGELFVDSTYAQNSTVKRSGDRIVIHFDYLMKTDA